MVGDFNAILQESKRIGGTESLNHKGRRAFREVMDYCHMLDAGCEGPK